MPWKFGYPAQTIQPHPWSDDKLRFIIVTDSHLPDPAIWGTLNLAVDDANRWLPQAVFHLGDAASNTAVAMTSSCYIMKDIRRPITLMVGNHDEPENPECTLDTAEIASFAGVDRPAPFYYSFQMVSGNGSLKARCLVLDTNLYDDVVSGCHVIGDRCGTWTYGANIALRGYDATQIAWVQARLAADSDSDIILLFSHMRITGDNVKHGELINDLLQIDGRPACGFCGHTHSNAEAIDCFTTDHLKSYKWYKTPDMLLTHSWCRFVLGFDGSNIVVDQAELQHYTNPGGYVINPPYTVAP